MMLVECVLGRGGKLKKSLAAAKHLPNFVKQNKKIIQTFQIFCIHSSLKCQSSHCSLSVALELNVEVCALLYGGVARLLNRFPLEILAFDPDGATSSSHYYL